MIVRLPWPDRRLSPNARVHRMERARCAAVAKEAAWMDTLNQLSVRERRALSERDAVHLAITFHPPDSRKRDLDNMLASAKSTLDGFAHACLIDDYRFSLSLMRGQPLKGGQIHIFIPKIPKVDSASCACCWGHGGVEKSCPATVLAAPRGANHETCNGGSDGC